MATSIPTSLALWLRDVLCVFDDDLGPGDGGGTGLSGWPGIAPRRPYRRTRQHGLRHTIEAIIWRCRNGAKRRDLPAELAPWWMAVQCFIRWAKLGVWERLLRKRPVRPAFST